MKFTDFNNEQLKLIEAGINEDLNVKSYVDTKLNTDELRLEFLIRLLAKHRDYTYEDVTEYFTGEVLGFNFKQIRELANGYRLKLPYELYKNPAYDYRQMKEIRIAMQKGEDFNLILSPRIPFDNMHTLRMNMKAAKFTERQMDIIRKCKKEGFNVSIISNPKFSYSKMRYILADMRAGRELEYLNGSYKSEHIKYIRKAMINHKDPKPLYNPRLKISKVISLYKCLDSIKNNYKK